MTPADTRAASTGTPAVFGHRWRRRALIAAVVWFSICLLYDAPATLCSALLRKLAPQLQLQNVAGSVWHGMAAQAFWQQNGQALALGTLEWHLQPWSLLWLHPSLHITTDYGEQFLDAHVRVSPFGALTLDRSGLALPISVLSHWAPLPARGQLALKIEHAEIARTQLRALRGTVYWQRAQWQWGSSWLALGDYRCALRMPAPQQVRCALQGQGALAIDGDVDVDIPKRAWSVQAQVKAAPSLPEQFRSSMQLMLALKPDAQGASKVTRNGHW